MIKELLLCVCIILMLIFMGVYIIEFVSDDEVVKEIYIVVNETVEQQIIDEGNLTIITCGKLYFNGTDNLTCDFLIIAPTIYDNIIYCNSVDVKYDMMYRFPNVEIIKEAG